MTSSSESPVYPQVCLRCGGWLQGQSICCKCASDNARFKDFYKLCLALEGSVGVPSRHGTHLYEARTHELHYGWLPDVLAIISAIVLGILSNASYDVIKAWLLSRKKEYQIMYLEPFKYERAIEILLEYVIENREKLSSFEIGDKDLRIEFRSALDHLRLEIETKAQPKDDEDQTYQIRIETI